MNGNIILDNLDNFNKNLLVLTYSLILKHNLKKIDRLTIPELNDFILENEYYSSITEYETLKAKLGYKDLQLFALDCIQDDLKHYKEYETNFLRRRISKSVKTLNDINFNNDFLQTIRLIKESIKIAA